MNNWARKLYFGASLLIGLQGGAHAVYVGANPLSGVDPAGLSCTSANGSTTCSYPGGPTFAVPTPAGFPDSLQPSDWLYHNYDVQNLLRGADPKCVMQKMSEHPTPGQSRAATPGGTANNAKVFGLNNSVTSYATVDLRSGAPVVVNITSRDSVLADGYVARTVVNGVVHTVGEGTNWKQSPNMTGHDTQFMANEIVWGAQMQRFIEECKCK